MFFYVRMYLFVIYISHVVFCTVPHRLHIDRSELLNFCSVLFCSVLFCSVLFCSVLFCSVLFCSVPFRSRSFYHY